MGRRRTPHSAVLIELEPVVAENLDRHIALATEWHPHDYVPWSRGATSPSSAVRTGRPEQSRLDETAKAAMITNLLTEDNLPSYHREIATRFGHDGAWGQWVGRWTAEENRHGIALRDYLVVTRGVDPVELERARMDYMVTGYDSGDKTPLQAVAYVSFQELATRVSHRNTGRATGDPIADKLLARIATDENLHMVFYRNLVEAAFEIDPDSSMRAVADEVIGFEMPGADHGELPAQLHAHRQGRDLRPAPAPRRGGQPDPARVEGLRAHRPRPRGRAGPRGARRVPHRPRRAGHQVRGEPRAVPRPRRRPRAEASVRPEAPHLGSGTVRLATWNVNSIRTRADRVAALLERQDVDVLALQETKCRDDQFPEMPFDGARLRGRARRLLAVERRRRPVPGGSGRRRRSAFPGSRLGRPVTPTRRWRPARIGATCAGVRVWSLYVPNGRALGDPHYAYKLDWLAALRGDGRAAGSPMTRRRRSR